MKRWYSASKADIQFNGVILGIVLLIIYSVFLPYFTSDTIVGTVADKGIAVSRNCSVYQISLTNGETLASEDQWLYLKFNSSDVYYRMEIGKTYKIHVCGWRIPVFSWWRNIISFEEVK